jgi:hypothetical protein
MIIIRFKKTIVTLVDRKHFDANSDPDQDPIFCFLMQIQIRIRILTQTIKNHKNAF